MVDIICTVDSDWWAYLVFTVAFGGLGILVGPLFGYLLVGSTKNDVSSTAAFYVRTQIMLLSFVFIFEFFKGLYDLNCQFNFGTTFIGVNTDIAGGFGVYDLRWWFILLEVLFLSEVVSQFFVHTLMPSLLQKVSMFGWALIGISLLRSSTQNFFWTFYLFGAFIVIVWFLMNYAYANIRPVVLNLQHLAHFPVLIWILAMWLFLAFDSVVWKDTFNNDTFNRAAPWLYSSTTLVFVLAEAVAVALLTVSRKSRNGDSNVIYPSYNHIAINGEKGESMVRDVGSNPVTDFLFGGSARKTE